jgi:hypothetical protein
VSKPIPKLARANADVPHFILGSDGWKRIESASSLELDEGSRAELSSAMRWFLIRSSLRQNAVNTKDCKKQLVQILKHGSELDRLLSAKRTLQTDAYSLISESLREIVKSDGAVAFDGLQYIKTAVDILTRACDKALNQNAGVGPPTTHNFAWSTLVETLDEWGRSKKLKVSVRKDSDKMKGKLRPHPYFKLIDALLAEIPREYRPTWLTSKNANPEGRLQAIM